MKIQEQEVPVFRSGFKFLLKFCISLLLISLLAGTFFPLTAYAQQTRVVTGTVVDSKGEPVIGASVVVKGTTIGANTDIDGKFRIMVPVDATTLVVSFIGMKAQDVDIAGKAVASVTMEDETIGLEEVVVVGYGTQKKVTVTGAVSAIAQKQLVQTPVANISNALAGRATGVLTVQRSGAPGEDQADLRIRGVGSYTGDQAPLIMVDGIETNDYNSIDPNEIENISILKDASSTAVYGVRGANGVLLITTKRGLIGKPQISYSANIAGTALVDVRERMGSYDYVRSYEEAARYESYRTGVYNQYFTDEEIELYRNQSDPVFYPNTDWIRVMYRDVSYQHQHNLNLRGGTENVKYFVSLGYFKQNGQLNNTNLQKDYFDMNSVFGRYNFRSNFDFKITKRLSAKLNISTQLTNKRGYNGENIDPMIRGISQANPLIPSVIDGKFLQFPVEGKVKMDNPLNYLYTGHRKTYNNYLDGSLRFDYDLGFVTKGLNVHFMTSYQNNNNFHVTYNKPREIYYAVKDAENNTIIYSNLADGAFSTSTGTGKRRRTYTEAGLNYARAFGNHNISGLLLYNQSKSFDPGYEYSIPVGYQGLVGRIAYDYGNRYLVEFNAGYNGTENFAPGKRFGYFPAYSLGWSPSEESFFPKNNIVTFLKFRGSYGEVGNDKIGGKRFLFLPGAYTYSGGSYYWGIIGSTTQAYGGAYEGVIGNPNLTWERARKLDIGMDISLWKDKIKITADLFREKRDNILSLPQSVPILSGMGNNIPAVNMGKVDNQGYDGDISFNNSAGKFNYWVKANYTFATNKIIFQDEVPNPYPYLERTGQRIGQYFGYIDNDLFNYWDEVNEAYRPYNAFQSNKPQPGEINVKDINGDGVIDQYDQGPLGYSNFPEITYGISTGFDYRGFDFSILFQGASHVTFIGTGRHLWQFGNWLSLNEYLLDGWTPERFEQGETIKFPHQALENTSALCLIRSTYYHMDGSYVRLRNLEIGYRFDKLRFMKAIGLSSARVYFTGSNLWTWSLIAKRFPGVDPEDRISAEIGNTEPYPRVAVYNVGFNVNF